jgi:hypothetical protein
MARDRDSGVELEQVWDQLESMFNAAQLWGQFCAGQLWIGWDPVSGKIVWQIHGMVQ